MAAELPRPGVEVIQEFRTVSPTVVTPTLVPCVVGVAKQIVEVLTKSSSGSSSLNANALITLPAFFVAPAGPYTGLDTLKLDFSVNNGPAVSITLSDPTAAGLSAASVVAQINDALATAKVTAILAKAVGTNQFELRTVGVGDFQSIKILSTTSPTVASAFHIGIGVVYSGLSQYDQYEVVIPQANFPDPRGNLSELSIDTDSIRAFVATEGAGIGLLEFKRDQTFLQNGVVATKPTITGSVDITTLIYPTNVTGLTINISHNGTSLNHTVASPANAGAFVAELNSAFSSLGLVFSSTFFGNSLAITTTNGGVPETLTVVSGTLLAVVGITAGATDIGVSIAAVDDGNGDVLTSLIDFLGYNFTSAAAAATVTGSAATTTPAANSTLIISDGQQPRTVIFAGTETTTALMATTINKYIGPSAGGRITAADNGSGSLRLTHSEIGAESYIEVLGGTALGNIDPGFFPAIHAGLVVTGTPYPPVAGDQIYIDGTYYADVSEVAPGGVVDRIKISKTVAISNNVGTHWYIIAKNLPAASRPTPDLTISGVGDPVLKHSFIRNTSGDATKVLAPIYLSYSAVRQDVTALAANPGLVKFEDTATLDTALEPVTTANPLALGLFFAMLNAPGVQVTGLGVDAVTADAPYGTVEAFTRAAEFLEAFEVYAIAPLTHDQSVAQVFNTHVTFMSGPTMKGERIVLWNPSVPTRKIDALVGSGTNGDGLTTTTFDTKIATLSALAQNAGVNPVGTIAASAGLYLDIASDDKKYSISAISGSVVTIRTSFAAGENDDGYYSTTALPTPLIAETFAVRVRGAALKTSTGQQDKTGVAETMQTLGQSFLNRRFWMTFPDRAAATLSGLEQTVEGFYMNAAIAGMIAQQPPQQSFTNFPMTGFTRVMGSNDTFSEKQLNIMAAGGTYIVIQDGQGAPLTARMALTTDLTSIETRTDSITKVVDFTAKFMRRMLKTFIGRFNITQGFLDSLGSVIQGGIGFLVESGILIGGTLNNIVQDEDAPDTVLVDITLDVPFPANYIRLTLVV